MFPARRGRRALPAGKVVRFCGVGGRRLEAAFECAVGAARSADQSALPAALTHLLRAPAGARGRHPHDYKSFLASDIGSLEIW